MAKKKVPVGDEGSKQPYNPRDDPIYRALIEAIVPELRSYLDSDVGRILDPIREGEIKVTIKVDDKERTIPLAKSIEYIIERVRAVDSDQKDVLKSVVKALEPAARRIRFSELLLGYSASNGNYPKPEDVIGKYGSVREFINYVEELGESAGSEQISEFRRDIEEFRERLNGFSSQVSGAIAKADSVGARQRDYEKLKKDLGSTKADVEELKSKQELEVTREEIKALKSRVDVAEREKIRLYDVLGKLLKDLVGGQEAERYLKLLEDDQ